MYKDTSHPAAAETHAGQRMLDKKLKSEFQGAVAATRTRTQPAIGVVQQEHVLSNEVLGGRGQPGFEHEDIEHDADRAGDCDGDHNTRSHPSEGDNGD